MSIVGQVQNGVVILPKETTLPEGTLVQIEPVTPLPEPSLADRLGPIIGLASGLPADLAEHHDHYLHGKAKP